MRVCFTNLGCKLNQAELEGLARRFAAAGHRVVESLAEAELHVVNTCTVTAEAARTSRRAARRAGPGVRTVLTGCWSSERPEEAARLAGVDLVVPNRDKERLLELVHERFPEGIPGAVPAVERPLPLGMSSPTGLVDRAEAPHGVASPAAESAATVPPVPWVPMCFGRTRALVKAEDGCDMGCAFCIIPHTRGRQRSRPAPEVLAEVRRLVAAGHREIVLTGVQISAYRWEGLRLADLVRLLLAGSEVPRLRLTSIAPWDLDDRLLGLWPEPRLCRHLHLSLQSGSTATLRRMHRPYTAEAFARLLARARATVPGVAVTTDVIAGFPGESEGELEESLAFVAAAGFAKVHAFPFSPRPGTEAAGLPGQVPPEVRRERMSRLLAVAERAERDFWAAQVGRRATVLWERPRGGVAQGLTDDYVRVLAQTGRDLWNRFEDVDLVGVEEGGVSGVLAGPG